MKTCSKCNKKKSNFYKEKKGDIYYERPECIDCTKEVRKKYRIKNVKKYKRYMRLYQVKNRDRIRIYKRGWYKKNRLIVLKNRKKRLEKNPAEVMKKLRARRVVAYHLNVGNIERPDTCSSCGKMEKQSSIHAHHTDYNKPLMIIWLCAVCHSHVHQAHSEMFQTP